MYRLILTTTAILTTAIVPCSYVAPNATAAVIAVDDFESHEIGSILDQGTIGDGWESAYSGLVSEREYSTPLRDVTSGVMAGFGRSLELGHTEIGARASNNNIVQRLFTPQTDTVYVGLAFKTTGFDTEGISGYEGDFVQVYLNNTSNTEGWVGSQNNSLSCGVDVNPEEGSGYFARKCGEQTLTMSTPTNDVVHRMVMKISKSGLSLEGYYDQVAVFVDQEMEGMPDAARGASEPANPAFDTVSVLHVRIWGMELEDRVYIDELRIATTYAEALPDLPILDPVPGDTNGDWIVDETDAKILASNWGASVTVGDVAMGDFNKDGVVDAKDAAILAAHWGNHAGSEAAAATAVPEPGALLLLLGMALAALPRRSRG